MQPFPRTSINTLKNNSILWDQIEVYERYAEQERALRTQAVNALRKHEEKMFGKLTDIKEVKDERSSEDEGPTSKKPRVNMMRTTGSLPEEEDDQRISDLIEKENAIKIKFNVTQEENRMRQRRLNVRHKELLDQFHGKVMPLEL